MTPAQWPDKIPEAESEPVDSELGGIGLPEAPLLAVNHAGAVWISSDGEIDELDLKEAAVRAQRQPPLLCHAVATANWLDCDPFPAYDLLTLFAFARPAAFCAPTARGLAVATGLPVPKNLTDAALALRDAAAVLLSELAAQSQRRDPDAPAIARIMADAGWPWSKSVLAALGQRAGKGTDTKGRLNVWDRLPNWSDQAPSGPPGSEAVSAAEARSRLAALLGSDAEARPQQADYASAVSQAFAPRDAEGEPTVVLAEAGTGVGKTLGYIAAASIWTEKNHGPVWLSTYTRNLQHQIDSELDRLYPLQKRKAERVVIRKGRENYLCLLNLEDAVRGLSANPQDLITLGLMARWAARTRDGDMVGGDFPGWLVGLAGYNRTLGLTDRRGECIYSACAHYRKCFIERSIRRAKNADIVIANHALVIAQAALGNGDQSQAPSHYVFDEGHHVFDAADNAFAAHLSGQETYELRRWILGNEGGRKGSSRARGLRQRVEDLIAGDQKTVEELDELRKAARALAGDGWRARLESQNPLGPTEIFLSFVRQQVYARSEQPNSAYSLEAETRPPVPGMLDAALELDAALNRLARPLSALHKRLARRLDEESGDLDSDTRRRIDATCRSLDRRGKRQIAAWRQMLAALDDDTPEEFVDWFAVERADGRDVDLGMHRHWIDPTIPFAAEIMAPAQGVTVTSATLTDGSGDTEADWAAALLRSGAAHLPKPAIRAQVASPFDYATQTRVFVINDVNRNDAKQVAAAYRELFLAAGGGALGLFTAISRLRAVHRQIAPAIEGAGLSLFSQHVDRLDTATLIDIFRAEENACLLGTDAVRDGVDVPGRSLRLIVFDRVPWARPDIRHKARREVFGGRAYDDRLTRLKLKQAYGRLIRRGSDHGVFVLLDPMMPSRLAGAFPEGVTVTKLGLAEAVAETRAFLDALTDS